jgi:hypothetical protein
MTNEKQPEFNQEDVDLAVSEAKVKWAKMLDESGLSQTMLLVTSKEASEFMGVYAMIQKEVIAQGFNMPNLVEGIQVNFPDEADNND